MLSFLPESIERYTVEHSTPESGLFQRLAQRTAEATDAPQMQIGPTVGLVLKLLARSLQARRVLEIGTFTGYSALMIAEGVVEGGEVITCDLSRSYTAIAREYWDQSPHGKKITLRLGRALETIREVEGPLDMVFIDADKESYIAYWDACVPKVRSGGMLLADNVLWSGRVLDPKEPTDHALAAFNTHVRSDPRVDVVMLAIRDGITIASKI
jgi:caffeoyl-CoA O-methyltransferase